jgi:Transglycosylase-like domain
VLALTATLTATLLSATAAHAWPAPPARRAACESRPVPALCKLHWWVRDAHRAEHLRHRPRTRYWYSAERHPLDAPWIEQRQAWRFRAQRITAIRLDPWTADWYAAAICIHQHEGAWTDDTGNGYYGGMQFDYGTWLAYGGGQFAQTANLAAPRDQLLVAYSTWLARGWQPWPVSSVECGL